MSLLVYPYLIVNCIVLHNYCNQFWRGTWDSPFSLLSLFCSLPLSSSCFSLSHSPVDKTWADRMWNIYSASAQSAMAAHTLYLPWREILSALPLPLTPSENLSPHWLKHNTNYMSHCFVFTAILKPASPVPNIRPQPDSVSAWLKKK